NVNIVGVKESNPSFYLVNRLINEYDYQIENINVEDSIGNGIILDSHNRLSVENIKSKNNSQNGLVLMSTGRMKDVFSDDTTPTKNLCSLTCSYCTNFVYPMILTAGSRCSRSFVAKANQGEVLEVVVSVKGTMDQMFIKDNANKFSTILQDYFRTKVTDVLKYISSNENMEFKYDTGRFGEIKIYINSVKRESKLQQLKNGFISENRKDGIQILNNYYLLSIDNFQILNNNEKGVYAYFPPSEIIFQNCSIHSNNFGIEFIALTGVIKTLNSRIFSNNVNGINMRKTDRNIDTFIQLTASNCQFKNHSNGNGIETTNDVNLYLYNNQFIDNGIDIRQNILEFKTDFLLDGNQFLNRINDGSVYRIVLYDVYYLNIRNNIIDGIKGPFLYHHHGDFYYADTNFLFWNNTIENSISEKPLLHLHLLSRKSSVEIMNNQFKNNSGLIESVPQNFPDYELSVIKIYSTKPVKIVENIFNNPKFSREVAISPHRAPPIDCTKNFWGSSKNFIHERILSKQTVDGYRYFNLFPYYINVNKTEESSSVVQLPFTDGILGGDVVNNGTTATTIKAGKYILKSSLRITQGSWLRIEEGVTIDVWPSCGVQVYGKLDILGTQAESIIFKTVSTSSRSDTNLTMDFNNEISYNHLGQIYPICGDGNIHSSTRAAICLSLGYSPQYTALRGSYKGSFKAITHTNCNRLDLSKCHVIMKTCSYHLRMQCHPIKWSGIGYLKNSLPSTISGFTLQDTGSLKYSLYIDLLKENLTNIRIRTNTFFSLQILNFYGNDEYLLDNIDIASPIGSDTKFFINHRGNLKITNSNIINNGMQLRHVKIGKNDYDFNRDEKVISGANCHQSLFVEEGQLLILFFDDYGLFVKCLLQFHTVVSSSLQFSIYKTNRHVRTDDWFVEDYLGKHQLNGDRLDYLVEDNQANVTVNPKFRWSDRQASVYILIESIPIGRRHFIKNSQLSIKFENVFFNYEETLAIHYENSFKPIITEISINNCSFEGKKIAVYITSNVLQNTKLFVYNSNFTGMTRAVNLYMVKFQEFQTDIHKCNFNRATPFHFFVGLINNKLMNNYSVSFQDNVVLSMNRDAIFWRPIVNSYSTMKDGFENMITSSILIKNNHFLQMNCLREEEVISLTNFGYIQIFGNTFESIRSCSKIIYLLGTDGDIEISKNRFQDITTTTSTLVLSHSRYSKEISDDVAIIDNDFTNINSKEIVKSWLIAKRLLLIKGNSIKNCWVSDMLVNFWASGKLLNDEAKFLENKLVNNTGGLYSLLLAGDSLPRISSNIFNNPQFKYELYNLIECPMGRVNECNINAKSNFWGTAYPYNRIYSSEQNGHRARMNISPFYKTIEMEQLEQIEKPKLNPKSFSGFIDKPYEVKENLILTGNVVFDRNVTIHPGVEITLRNSFDTIVFRDRVVAIGTLKKPIIFSSRQQLKTLRLYNNYLQIKKNDNWFYMKFADKASLWHENRIICSYFGYDYHLGVNHGKSYSSVARSSTIVNCESWMDNLEDCFNSSRTIASSILRYLPKFYCHRKLNRNGIFLFNAKQQSIFQYIEFNTVGLSSISGPAPKMKNIVWSNQITALTIIDSYNLKTWEGSQFSVKDAEENGMYFGNSNHEMHISLSKFSNVKNGIVWKEFKETEMFDWLDSEILLERLWNPFSFCSAEEKYQLKADTMGYWFNHQFNSFKNYIGCTAVFECPKGYQIEIRAICSNCYVNHDEILKVYDWQSSDLLSTFFTKDKIFKFLSVKRTIKLITYFYTNRPNIFRIIVQAVKVPARYCDFEESFCTWKNSQLSIGDNPLNNPFVRIIGYNATSIQAKRADVDFPQSQLGHYLGYFTQKNRRCYTCTTLEHEQVLLADEYFNQNDKVCFITLYAYMIQYDRVKHLKIYAQSDNRTELVESVACGSSWKFYRVSLAKYIGKRFRILIATILESSCIGIVGIDRIVYEYCPSEKSANQLTITNTIFNNCTVKCIDIMNNDQDRHNTIWLDKMSFNQMTNNVDKLIQIHLQSAYILLRNLNIPYLKETTAVDVIFHSKFHSRISNLVFTQNSIMESENSIILTAINKGVNKATALVQKCSIENNSGSKRLFILENFQSNFTRNFLYKNLLENELLSLKNCKLLPVFITSCSFYYNIARDTTVGIVHAIESYSIDIQQSIFYNPNTDYDFSISTAKDDLIFGDLGNNWWNTAITSNVLKRILDGRIINNVAIMNVLPLLQSEPKEISTSKTCPVAWKFISSGCFYIHFGAGSIRQANDHCKSNTAYLLSDNYLKSSSSLLNELLYTDLDGKEKISDIWTRDSIPLDNEVRPWICRKGTFGICPNNCRGRGICSGTICICNSGWEGTDCSIFNCNHVSNCSAVIARGSCIGPNTCKCNDGWRGDNCAISSCSRYFSCDQCTLKKGCGWCDSTQKCLPGNEYKPYFSCPNWFYRNCISISNKNCSREIEIVACNDTICKNPSKDTKGVCQECNDLKYCFDNEQSGCATWNETRCKGGVPQPDLSRIERQDFYELKDNVIKIPPTTKIFRCFTKEKLSNEDDTEEDYEILLIPTYQRLLSSGQIILSTQARGIMHRVLKVWRTSAKYLGILVKFANPLDIFKYAHSRFESNDNIIQNPKSIDNSPTEEEMDEFLQSNQTYLELDSMTNILKCTGDEYKYNEETIWSYNILTKSTNPSLVKDQLLLVSKPQGYLEQVTKFRRSDADVFIETKLYECSQGLSTNDVNRLDSIIDIEPEMECDTGDSMNGLHYKQRDNFKKVLTIGDLVVGRSALPSLGFVLELKSLRNGWRQIEVLDLGSISANLNSFDYNRSNLTKVVRKKRSMFTKGLSKRLSSGFSISVKGGGGSVQVSGKLSLSAAINFELKISHQDFAVERAKLTADGRFTINSNIQASFNGEYTSSLYEKVSTIIRRRNIPISIPIYLIPVPGKIGIGPFKVGPVTGSVAAKADFSGNTNNYIGYNAGVRYNRGLGANKIGRGAYKGSGGGGLGGSWSAATSITVGTSGAVKFTWPSVGLGEKLNLIRKIYKKIKGNRGRRRRRRGIVKSLLGKLQKTKFDFKFKLSLESSIELQLNQDIVFRLGFCDTTHCTDPDTPNSAGVYFGNSNLIGTYSLLFIQLSSNTPISTGLSPIFKHCFSLPKDWKISQKCCICKKENGKYGMGIPSEKYKACLCPCICKGEKKESSWKLPDKECSCCQDGSRKPLDKPDFKCPCKCPDKSESIMEKDGCKCPKCDKCPDGSIVSRAPDGSCPCKNNCGVNSVCTPQRKGRNCDQPFCPPDNTCSGRGVCKASGKCGASCICNRRFTGQSCERMLPRAMWGDPHLETFDGRSFDYFGIGQFWGCKSRSLAYQYRFFGYKGTSFIGQMAIKVGQISVLTITTNGKSSPNDLPTLRLDGNIQIDLENDKNLLFDNETIRMDISSTLKSNGDDNPTVLLVSINYAHGESLLVAASFSPKMKRQYLSVTVGPIVKLFNRTSGLCGFMNDDPSDDLMGPDGTNYTSFIEFTESWRIPLTIRDDGGLANSWSSSLSNFHKDDSIDQSYNDPTHKPLYSIKDFPKERVTKAKEICSIGKSSQIVQDQCITDIVMTNDESLGKQISLQSTLCPNQCSHRGNCVNGTCICIKDWSGLSCDYGKCGKCDNGNCLDGFCKCEPGFIGSSCNETAECKGNCSSNGKCIDTNVCKCNDGWISANCSEEAICNEGCSNRGVCIDHNVCKCNIGFGGKNCSIYTCENWNKCSGNGLCVEPGNCACFKGWKGLSCSQPICRDDCSSNGECIQPDVCKCYKGFVGDFCSEVIACPKQNNCYGNGICIGDDQCTCDIGYKSENCSQPVCDNSCEPNGVCDSPNRCKCKNGFAGDDCSLFSCEKLSFCSGHGKCQQFDNCLCDENWYGDSCNIPGCSGVADCSKNGQCIGANQCQCEKGFEGENCSLKIQLNLAKPIFLISNYSSVVSEYIEEGELLFIVEANDTDSGQAGIVYYALNSSPIPVDIDSINGRITARGPIKPGEYELKIDAIDNGLPAFTTTAILSLSVIDINECATIEKPVDQSIKSDIPIGSLIYQITATDNDLGLNSELIYDFSISGYSTQEVGISIENGTNKIVSVKSPLNTGKYEIIISVYDKSDNPCTSTSKVTVLIFPPEMNTTGLQVKQIIGEGDDQLTTIGNDNFKTTEISSTKSITTTKQQEVELSTSSMTNDITFQTKEEMELSTTSKPINGDLKTTKILKEQSTKWNEDKETTAPSGETEQYSTENSFEGISTSTKYEKVTVSDEERKFLKKQINDLEDEVYTYKTLMTAFAVGFIVTGICLVLFMIYVFCKR
ncbi:DgyrCDS14436, partial [Dimorphilus gyrociliatus]